MLNDSDLHPEADPEERNFLLTSITDGADFTFNSPVTETARNQDAANAAQHLFHVLICNFFRMHPADLHVRIGVKARMGKRLNHTEVGVVQGHVFTDNGDLYRLLKLVDPVNQAFPLRHIRSRGSQLQVVDYDLIKPFFAKVQRHLVECIRITALHNRTRIDITEEGDFGFHIVRQLMLCTANDDIRLNPDTAKFFDTVLSRLGLHFTGSLDIRDQSNVNIHHVLASNITLDLADGFQERQTFDIPNRAPDLCNHDIRASFAASTVDTFFDLIRNMGNNLNCTPEILTTALFTDDRRIHLTGRYVAVLR
ncbi:hypothetical protein D3C73_480280 [compost metagenome]